MEFGHILTSAVICIGTLANNNTKNNMTNKKYFNIECTINGLFNHTYHNTTLFNEENYNDYKCLFNGNALNNINKKVKCISQQLNFYECNFLYFKINDPCNEENIKNCLRAVVTCPDTNNVWKFLNKKAGGKIIKIKNIVNFLNNNGSIKVSKIKRSKQNYFFIFQWIIISFITLLLILLIFYCIVHRTLSKGLKNDSRTGNRNEVEEIEMMNIK